VGIPLGFGLLWKRKFALVVVYAMFGLSLLLVAIQLPVAMEHFRDSGGAKGGAIAEAEMLLVWLCAIIYYGKRRLQFH
jgi:hypothetical protein